MRPTIKSTNGTSFHDTTIRCSVSDLREILGQPTNESNDGSDKVNFEWEMETDDGDAFTVYDWKEGRPLDEYEIIEWNIGGHSVRITEQAKKEIISFL